MSPGINCARNTQACRLTKAAAEFLSPNSCLSEHIREGGSRTMFGWLAFFVGFIYQAFNTFEHKLFIGIIKLTVLRY